uniref:4-hydroxy-4-methyl-2-oxoglutarate aldolase HMG aldolase Oxaloacetate decarboxylase n=1 Tax=Rhizophora mucronata TaxID=61149 RepID=A0A2P2IWA7_RHIMU
MTLFLFCLNSEGVNKSLCFSFTHRTCISFESRLRIT